MFVVSTTQFGGATERLDLDSIKIDGQLAYQMPADQLFRALKNRGVDVVATMGRQELLTVFARWLDSRQ
jgi:hypothetical protein